MALILNIDTSVESASACLAKDGQVLVIKKNNLQKDHATWLHSAINEILKEKSILPADLDAVAVTIGPGSYTGLRIGLATAKGICYALGKPLIAVNTLLMMANAIKNEPAELLCPMIDARRMEVFTALFTKDLEIVKAPTAMLIDQNSFATELGSATICFSGNGNAKLKKVLTHKNAFFSQIESDVSHLSMLSESLFLNKQFADLAYTEPLYLKEFYSPGR